MSDTGLRLARLYTNGFGGSMTVGTVVRISASQTVTKAQATSLTTLAGLLGVTFDNAGTGGNILVSSHGSARLQLEAGLTPVAGQMVYVSNTAGLGTNVAPSIAFPIGIIRDATRYTQDSTVEISLQPGEVTLAAGIEADWPLSIVRYFLVDYDGGNDSNVGYIDAAPGADLTGLTTGLPIKTLTRLVDLVPKVGANRIFAVLIKPRAGGAVYRTPDNTADDDVKLEALCGYSRMVVRGSDLTNTTTDKILVGAQIGLAGPNGDSSFTVDAGPTTSVISAVGGGLPAEFTITGMRVRFKGNVTAALTNAVAMIYSNTPTAITFGQNTSVSAAAGDQFFIEKPGVAVNRVLVNGPGATSTSLAGRVTPMLTQDAGFQVAGIEAVRSALGIAVSGTYGFRFAFCHLSSVGSSTWLSAGGFAYFLVSTSYRDEVGTSGTVRTVGPTRSAQPTDFGQFDEGNPNVPFGGQVTFASAAFSGISTTFSHIQVLNGTAIIGGGNVWRGRLQVSSKAQQYTPFTVTFTSRGAAAFMTGRFGVTTIRDTRYDASALLIDGGAAQVDGAAFTNTTFACIEFRSESSSLYLANISGSAGNNTYGLNIRGRNSIIEVKSGEVPTVLGALGQIICVGNATFPEPKLTWADIQIADVVDAGGNTIKVAESDKICAIGQPFKNDEAFSMGVGEVMRADGAGGGFLKQARANTAANAKAVVGVSLDAVVSAEFGLLNAGSLVVVKFDDVPTVGEIAYLSPTTAATLTTTVPALAATNQKLRCGIVLRVVTGVYAVVAWHPENLAVLADGLA